MTKSAREVIADYLHSSTGLERERCDELAYGIEAALKYDRRFVIVPKEPSDEDVDDAVLTLLSSQKEGGE